MTPVTGDLFIWVIGLLIAFIGLNWLHTHKSDQTLHSRISNTGRRIDEFKLEVSEKYVSVEHLKEVEGRLIDEIKGLRTDIQELTRALSRPPSRQAKRTDS